MIDAGMPTIGGWVYAMGWDEAVWGGEQPHKSWLDEVCADKPVILTRMCGHKVIINTLAGRRPHGRHISCITRLTACLLIRIMCSQLAWWE